MKNLIYTWVLPSNLKLNSLSLLWARSTTRHWEQVWKDHCFKLSKLVRNQGCCLQITKPLINFLHFPREGKYGFFFKNCVWILGSPELTAAAAPAKSLQLCLTLWDPTDGSPPGSPIPGIFQARTLKWVAISFSNAWKWKVKVKSLTKCPTFHDPHGLQPTRLLCPWDFPDKSTGVGCHCPLLL